MQEVGVVSVWVGSAKSESRFDEVTKAEFSEDGAFVGSQFSRAFDVGYYDEGLKEAAYLERAATDFGEILRGASYEDAVVPRFEANGEVADPANCVVLLYNQRHEGLAEWAAEGIRLRFVGTVSYQ